jgi:hypothetical protein
VSRRPRQRPPDPFAALGLTATPELTDDDVRAAWRRVAAATHPDRSDGGDPARFAAAAAAYTELRTRFGRGEAMADVGGGAQDKQARWLRRTVVLLPARIRRGRPGRLALRVLAAAAASAAVVAAAGSQPAEPALITGALTWLLLTARQDLAPPPE